MQQNNDDNTPNTSITDALPIPGTFRYGMTLARKRQELFGYADWSNLPVHDPETGEEIEESFREKDHVFVRNIKPVATLDDFTLLVRSWDEVKNSPFSAPEYYIYPVLERGQIVTVSAQYGVGKSLFVDALAVSLTHAEVPPIGIWEVRQNVPVLVIDGEMTDRSISARLTPMIGSRKMVASLGFLTVDFIERVKHAFPHEFPNPSLCNSEFQGFLTQHILDFGYKVVIFDNLSALAPGLDENSKKEWDPVLAFFRKLRFHGITVIEVAHMGKNQKTGTRGSTGLLDNPDTLFDLSSTKDRSGRFARFKVSLGKGRELMDNRDFILEFTNDPDQPWITHTQGSNSESDSDDGKGFTLGERGAVLYAIRLEEGAKITQDRAGKDAGCKKQVVSEAIKKMKKAEYLDKTGKLTQAGRIHYADLIAELTGTTEPGEDDSEGESD